MLKIAAPILAFAALTALAKPVAADPLADPLIEISNPYTCRALYLDVTLGPVNRPGTWACPPKP